MAAQGGGGQEGSDKNTYYILWLVALVVFVCGIIWYFLSEQLKVAFIFIRTNELRIIYGFFDILPQNLPWIGTMLQQSLSDVSANLDLAKELSPDILTLDIASSLSETVGDYLRYPLVLYLIGLTVIIFKSNVQLRLRKKFNMKTLAVQEEVIWPQIKIATKHDILSQDLDEGPWAMAMSPMQFAKKNKLVTIELADISATQFSKVQAPEYKVTLDRIRAERAFSVQLGRTWYGIESLAPHRRAILTVFIARGCRDTKAAYDLVAQLANSGADGKLDDTGVDALWKKHINNKRVQEIFHQHAYEFTVFISMLLFAREDGVVASSDYLWVKPLDRRLWYVINNVGRQTPSVEVGGIFSHWYYEMALKRSLSAPRVIDAVDAFELALNDIIYVPTEAEKEEILKRHETQRSAAKPEEQPAV